MKKLSIIGAKEALSRNEMKAVKAGNCYNAQAYIDCRTSGGSDSFCKQYCPPLL